MSDNKPTQAEVKNLKQVSAIWIIPIVALAIGIWMLAQYITSKGPEITLRMPTAEGIEVGKTQIKSLNVKVGVVTNIKLSDDYSYITVTARMNKDAERMLRDDTLFWVVKPRIGKEGISGLDTLLSGSYIELQPGKSDIKKYNFKVLDVPPIAPPDAKGLRVVLTNKEAGKLSVGDPVLYEGFTVGRVEQVSFNTKTKLANYHLFIFQPYDSLIQTTTKFWLASGVDFQMSASGINVKIGSLESLITGGVSFGLPDGVSSGEKVITQNEKYRLYDNMKQVTEGMYDKYLPYVMLFKESIRGLQPGAPVEYRGVRIGTVEKVPFKLPTNKHGFSNKMIPILVHIELGRITQLGGHETLEGLKADLQEEFKTGLRATLKTGSLITGALFIDLNVDPDEKAPKQQSFDGYDIFPTKAGGFAEVQKQVTDLLKKLNNLPVEKTVNSLNSTLAATEKTLQSAERVTADLDRLLKQKDTQQLPADIRQSLKEIQHTLNSYGPNGAPYQNLEGALNQFLDVMQELQPVLKQINKKPNSLIFGGDKTADPIPAGGK
ncbi:Paraquat-inducible protein B [Photobacterium damselae subsp. piscicida]|uniref:Intermembrane transport protein PqiB n=1 Tax=Photobacterium damsela subsp. piscicida TaxID=38294 RepID=A0A1V1VD96_PHODP|nr:intermembrane transport protein PqiB [Photobacterium damselae]MBE8127316.1 intermembrane transport protein PqiB [Photobacterium damselae subsp. piscicida]MDP2516759.1 intermembrane transport protein PqiB [Photobacterium damselae subsp. piscicida]MDP2543480.1 intermembrane transport protein PqiB [Photobacterium damselae subsp. piscicida]PSV71803.1 intermembrane transport protein PqiB [Photobacterium damselae]PSW77355.1 intermembrane transport protein PqiB [Photobacterium damselae]